MNICVCVSGGDWRDGVLQADLQQLQDHQTGGSQGNSSSHPLWSKNTNYAFFFFFFATPINIKQTYIILKRVCQLNFRVLFISALFQIEVITNHIPA